MEKNYFGADRDPMDPSNENIRKAIELIRKNNLSFGKQIFAYITNERLEDAYNFDIKVRELCDWLGEYIQPKVTRSRRDSVFPMILVLSKVFPDFDLKHAHLAVAMELAGYIVDFNESFNHFRANWKWGFSLRSPRRRVDYQLMIERDRRQSRMERCVIQQEP